MHGEGRTPDTASAALAAKNKAIGDGLRRLLGADTEITGSDATVAEVRAPECDARQNYDSRPRLSEGACAVIGHIASLRGLVKTAAVDKAATAVGLAARLGARNTQLQGFELSDHSAARQRATAAAIVDARTRAEVLANGAGVRLGELLTLSDPNGPSDDVTFRVMGVRRRVEDIGDFAPPVAIDIKPRPIETQMRVNARYAIAR